ncbi:tol-pal system-associated acyl-CoA thioesterase [Aliiglaciecola sp. CAU 1673]|uniref:tol-pal system-associated acyl-CoA thioesterase n=1 Tax=Aliiglaciecola sp. CAU 1673 TaxID=3032595 RepID=UPI0023DB6530|nr:tol-pal system-associated acyl-CoA thioesterase [Aliiglaciecola sp. CAU 1673]MDF2177198.1 tol-pal system-associated acyl-CoA thioesterase [Aliiglaciecola sp. CAU 1673]
MDFLMTHAHPIRVYYEDTDAGGIVYYANYLKFMERARTEWLRDLGIDQDVLLEQSVGFVVKRVELDYQAPARFNQLLTVKSQMSECKRASLVFKQEIVNDNDKLLVSATVVVVCVDLMQMKAQAIPAFILGELSRAR